MPLIAHLHSLLDPLATLYSSVSSMAEMQQRSTAIGDSCGRGTHLADFCQRFATCAYFACPISAAWRSWEASLFIKYVHLTPGYSVDAFADINLLLGWRLICNWNW